MSVLLRLAYDGTDFHGYARQRGPDGVDRVRTVQGQLEAALEVIFKEPVASRAASRTDAGVHARGQLVALEPPHAIPPLGLALGLTSLLPRDMTVTAAWEEEGTVDVRGGNGGKHYRYRVRCNPCADPLGRRTAWHLARELEPSRLQEICDALVGTHDFAAFRAADCQARTTERTITSITVTGEGARHGPEDPGRVDDGSRRWSGTTPDEVVLDVRGTAFLKNMVRIMVGTVVDVALERRTPDAIVRALATGRREDAGMTAPARGLTLMEVSWPGGT